VEVGAMDEVNRLSIDKGIQNMHRTPARLTAPLMLGLLAVLGVLSAARVSAANVEVGQPAPDFRLPDETGQIRSLADFKGKILILAFYPKDFTGG
jgi:hypothetical protein